MRGVGLVVVIALGACASTQPPAAPAPVAASAPAAEPTRARSATADTDSDGIPDAADQCPDDPETRNGNQDDDGCPDFLPQPPASPSDVARIVERIGFQYDSAEIRPPTYLMLDAIAMVLKLQPQQFPLVALEGHAAANEHSPMRLSLARASAVRVALLSRGVDPGRLLARASGAMAATCVQESDACRASERTVEFITLAASKAPARGDAEGAETDVRPAPAQAPDSKPAPEPAAAASGAPLERVEFARSSAVLAPAALANLDVLAGFLKANTAALEIVGYADERERDTAALASARAEAVRRYMMACGVSADHLVTRAERTSRATCRSHSANCSARAGRAELRFAEPQSPTPAPANEAPPASQ